MPRYRALEGRLDLLGLVPEGAEAVLIDGKKSPPFEVTTVGLWGEEVVVEAGRARMSIEARAHAAQTTSDNVAANLLIRELGGPEAFTAMLRETGGAPAG